MDPTDIQTKICTAMEKRLFDIRTILILLILCFIGTEPLNAQRQKNNIYLFDCTGSMRTNGLWNPAKDALDATIATQTNIDGSQFSVIPFGDSPYGIISFDSDGYLSQKKNIDDTFEKYIASSKYTRISDVLQEGFTKVDPRRDNRIYLLTDGLPNQGDTPEKVAQTITAWCSKHKNTRFFYVALKNDVINPVIKQAIDNCPDAFIVQCRNRVIPQIADISTHVYTNIEELEINKPIEFSLPGEYGLSISENDSLFSVEIDNGRASGGKINLKFRPRQGYDIGRLHETMQGGDYEFSVDISCTDSRYFIANPTLTVHVSDKMLSELAVADGLDQLNADGVEWHDSFLWSQAAPESKVEWNLVPVFKNELQRSALKLRFVPGEGEAADFEAWLNDEPLPVDGTFDIVPGSECVLSVRFNHNAATGERYFNLIPVEIDAIDMINDKPVDAYEGTSLRTSYVENWNPLKTFLFWLGVVLLFALLLWLIVLKRIFFPVIKVGRIEFTGPGSYYVSKRLKNARKVVFTSKKQSQNIISRILTGEIRFVRAEHFDPDIIVEPSGRGKKVKIRSVSSGASGWDIYPAASFAPYEKGTAVKRSDKTRTEFELS